MREKFHRQSLHCAILLLLFFSLCFCVFLLLSFFLVLDVQSCKFVRQALCLLLRFHLLCFIGLLGATSEACLRPILFVFVEGSFKQILDVLTRFARVHVHVRIRRPEFSAVRSKRSIGIELIVIVLRKINDIPGRLGSGGLEICVGA